MNINCDFIHFASQSENMLPFIFKISIKRGSIHFFPKNKEDFPFYLNKEARHEHEKIEAGLNRTFEKLLIFQKYFKRRLLNEFKLDQLLLEINSFMKETNTHWKKTAEVGIDEYDFFVFTLVSNFNFAEKENLRRKHLEKYKPYTLVKVVTVPTQAPKISDPEKKEVSPFFRPWN